MGMSFCWRGHCGSCWLAGGCLLDCCWQVVPTSLLPGSRYDDAAWHPLYLRSFVATQSTSLPTSDFSYDLPAMGVPKKICPSGVDKRLAALELD